MTKGRRIITDPDAKSAEADKPAFLAQPPGSPAYYGFLVVEGSETDGWGYGAITAYEGVGEEDAGDGFVITPDGARAGIVWSVAAGPEFEMIMPPDEKRWGVFELRFPKPVSCRKDLIENFRAVLPRLKEQYERIRKKGLTATNASGLRPWLVVSVRHEACPHSRDPSLRLVIWRCS